MKLNRSRLLFVGAAALALLALGSRPASEKCCFTHPSYSGTCEVVPAEGESCGSILQYLNTPMSQGKTYCGGTDLRGGWKLVSCEETSR